MTLRVNVSDGAEDVNSKSALTRLKLVEALSQFLFRFHGDDFRAGTTTVHFKKSDVHAYPL